MMHPSPTKLLTPAELVTRWRDCVTLVTLATWRSRKNGPPYVKVGGRVLYPLDGVEAWEKKRTFGTR
jgi:hypothetical protein